MSSFLIDLKPFSRAGALVQWLLSTWWSRVQFPALDGQSRSLLSIALKSCFEKTKLKKKRDRKGPNLKGTIWIEIILESKEESLTRTPSGGSNLAHFEPPPHPLKCTTHPVSVTRLGDFLNLLVTIFLTKVVQIFWELLGLFKIMQHSCKKYLCYFLGNIGKIEQLFIPSSGHTAPCPEKCVYGGSIFLIAIIPLCHSLKIISFSGLGTERCVRMGAFSVLDWILWAVALQWRNLLPNQLMFIL